MENPIKIDDLGVPLFLETPMWTNTQIIHETKFLLEKWMYWDENSWLRFEFKVKAPVSDQWV